MTNPRTLRHSLTRLAVLPAAALALSLTLSACGGDDDEPSSSTPAASDAADTAADTADDAAGQDAGEGELDSDGVVVDQLEEGGLDGVDDALDAVGSDFLFETAIEQISKSLSSSSGFDIDGYTGTIEFDKTQDEGSSDCIIGTSVLDAFEFDEEPTLVMSYTDGDVTC